MTKTLLTAIEDMGLRKLVSNGGQIIVDESMSIVRDFAGIYFLIKDKEIVYIGQSITPTARILNHCKEEKKDFDSFYVHHCSVEDLNVLETIFIIHYKPRYNSCPKNPIDEWHPYAMTTIGRIKQTLKENCFDPRLLKKWNKGGLISPVAHFDGSDFYWYKDFSELMDNLIKERGQEKHKEMLKQYKMKLEERKLEWERNSEDHLAYMQAMRKELKK